MYLSKLWTFQLKQTQINKYFISWAKIEIFSWITGASGVHSKEMTIDHSFGHPNTVSEFFHLLKKVVKIPTKYLKPYVVSSKKRYSVTTTREDCAYQQKTMKWKRSNRFHCLPTTLLHLCCNEHQIPKNARVVYHNSNSMRMNQDVSLNSGRWWVVACCWDP